MCTHSIILNGFIDDISSIVWPTICTIINVLGSRAIETAPKNKQTNKQIYLRLYGKENTLALSKKE